MRVLFIIFCDFIPMGGLNLKLFLNVCPFDCTAGKWEGWALKL